MGRLLWIPPHNVMSVRVEKRRRNSEGHMNGYASVGATGASLAATGAIMDQLTLVGIAAGLVLTGAIMIRFGFRRGKTPLDI